VVIVIVASPGADVRPHPTGAASKSIGDLHLELFHDETEKLAQSVVECTKENGADKSIDEVTSPALFFSRNECGDAECSDRSTRSLRISQSVCLSHDFAVQTLLNRLKPVWGGDSRVPKEHANSVK